MFSAYIETKNIVTQQARYNSVLLFKVNAFYIKATTEKDFQLIDPSQITT